MSRFADDTAVTPLGGGRYAARIDEGWWIQRGPNGGYLAAIVLRAIVAEVGDPERRPRSMTLHYLRPPANHACEVEVVIERAGRGLTTATARLRQDGRDCIVAVCALGIDRPGAEVHDHPAPDVPPPGDVPERFAASQVDVPFRGRFEVIPALGTPPFQIGDEALTGGWIRPADHDAIDEVLLAAVVDAWPPAVFSRVEVPVGVPTVDLTVHFRRRPPNLPGWLLVRFRTSLATEGYLEEDGEVWSEEGELLAQSRQLAVVVAPS